MVGAYFQKKILVFVSYLIFQNKESSFKKKEGLKLMKVSFEHVSSIEKILL